MRGKIITIILSAVLILFVGIIAIHEIVTPFHIQRINQMIENGNHAELEIFVKKNRLSLKCWPLISSFLTAATDGVPLLSPLETACRANDEAAVDILLKYGADPNFRPPFQVDQHTPLSLAAGRGNVVIVRSLLEHGASAPTQGTVAMNAYLRHRMNRKKDSAPLPVEDFCLLLQLLEEHGYVLDTQSHTGYTPIEFAALYGDIEVIQLLLSSYQLDASAQSYKGQTILHLYIVSGWQRATSENVTALLTMGIDPAVVDSNGKTAYDYSVENGYDEIAQLLQKTQDRGGSLS